MIFCFSFCYTYVFSFSLLFSFFFVLAFSLSLSLRIRYVFVVVSYGYLVCYGHLSLRVCVLSLFRSCKRLHFRTHTKEENVWKRFKITLRCERRNGTKSTTKTRDFDVVDAFFSAHNFLGVRVCVSWCETNSCRRISQSASVHCSAPMSNAPHSERSISGSRSLYAWLCQKKVKQIECTIILRDQKKRIII